MMTELTEGARENLDRYLHEVRHSLEGQTDVSAHDVVGGIREHVEAELGSRGEGVATAEDLADVLERLGPPSAWSETSGGPDEGDPRVATGIERRMATVALGLVGTGAALVLANALTAVGWGLLVAGSVAARAGYDSRGRTGLAVESRAALGWARFSTLLAVLAVLFGPAIYVWGASQIGGVIEAPLEGHLDLVGSERPLRYWLAMGALAAAVSGAWWICVGTLIRRFERPARHLLGPLRTLLSVDPGRRLQLGGVVLLALSPLGLVL